MTRIGTHLPAGMFLMLVVGPSLAQVDADAALALAKRNDCFKCHAIDKTKKAPAYKRIAARLSSSCRLRPCAAHPL